MEGLIFGGASVKIYAVGNRLSLLIVALFCFVFQGNIPGDFSSEGRFNGGCFCVMSSGVLYLEKLIHGGCSFPGISVCGN